MVSVPLYNLLMVSEKMRVVEYNNTRKKNKLLQTENLFKIQNNDIFYYFYENWSMIIVEVLPQLLITQSSAQLLLLEGLITTQFIKLLLENEYYYTNKF
jgi:hypothetical protein